MKKRMFGYWCRGMSIIIVLSGIIYGWNYILEPFLQSHDTIRKVCIGGLVFIAISIIAVCIGAAMKHSRPTYISDCDTYYGVRDDHI